MAGNTTSLYYLRHCQSDTGNHDELNRGLTAKGMADRVLIRAYFQDIDLDAAWSSPYLRARLTVEPLAASRDMAVHLHPDLRERENNGWTPDVEGMVRRLWANFEGREGREESLLGVQTRGLGVMRRLLQVYPGKSVVIGSHGTAMSVLIRYFEPEFNADDFLAIKEKMPWLVRFRFAGQDLIDIKKHDFFA